MMPVSELTWMERVAIDTSLRDFIEAELVRCEIEVVTLRHQHETDQMKLAIMDRDMKALRAEIKLLRKDPKNKRKVQSPLDLSGTDYADRSVDKGR